MNNIDFVKSKEHFDAFFRTMYERQLIWKRRFIDKQQGPWTTDPIFKTYKFTNVYRELDKNSQYCINKIIKPNVHSSLENLVWKTLVFRLFNNPNTFNQASIIWLDGIPSYDYFETAKDDYRRFMVSLQDEGQNIFTSAYLIYSSAADGRSRAEYYTEIVLPKLHSLVETIIDTCMLAAQPEEILTVLKQIPGVADFVAFELYNDMLYINKFTRHILVPFDLNAYVNIGPGSKMGAQLINPSATSKVEIREIMYALLHVAEEQLSILGDDYLENMPYAYYDYIDNSYKVTDKFNFTISNIEHWLCEYSKYARLFRNTGKKQKKFIPTSNNNIYD